MARTYTNDKGTQIMEGMLLSQYKNSTILKQYMGAFVEELDELYETIERVFYGRMLEDAIGVQLDYIGNLLDLFRGVNISKVQFGFIGAAGSEGFGDLGDPAVGGVFRSYYDAGFDVAPMDDNVYRKALEAKALLLNTQTPNIETIYKVIITLIGRSVPTLNLSEPAPNEVVLTIASSEVTSDEVILIDYMSKYYIKGGSQFTINLL